ncbi:ferredoxin [Rhodococcus koreensis]
MSMKLSLNLNGCMGYACCMMESPELFDLDEDTGLAILLVEHPDGSMREQAETAVRACPAGVISLSFE